jgi:hypothetical protein
MGEVRKIMYVKSARRCINPYIMYRLDPKECNQVSRRVFHKGKKDSKVESRP